MPRSYWISESVPKTMKVRAKPLTDRFKRKLSWTERSDLTHHGALVDGSNTMNIVNDVMNKGERANRSDDKRSQSTSNVKLHTRGGDGKVKNSDNSSFTDLD